MMDLIVYRVARAYGSLAVVGDRIPQFYDLGVDLRVRDTLDQVAECAQVLTIFGQLLHRFPEKTRRAASLGADARRGRGVNQGCDHKADYQ